MKNMEVSVQQGMQEMVELLYQFLWSHLQSLGLFREKHTVLNDLREQAGISAGYDRWLQESITLLERQRYLHCHNTSLADGYATCTVVDPTLIESATLWQRWDQLKDGWMHHTDLKAQVILVETTLRTLPAILTGQRPATEVLFPNGSMQLVEGIYQHNVIADYFNDVLATLLVTYLQERLAGEKHALIRILEIGAGTGGTTNRVLRMLQPYQASVAEYCYSDISEAFLLHGQQMYRAEHSYLTYRLLNAEKPLAGQGIEAGSYDVVIATNVLHATSNIERTVRNTKAALKKHGLLLLNEITGANLFAHLTFGLLEGWWAYEDPELRVPGCPALTAENWEMVLSSEGFGAIFFPTLDIQEASQQVIVAESNGVVRQARKQSDTNTRASQLAAQAQPESRRIVETDDRKGSAVRRSHFVTDQTIKDHVRSIILESIAEVLKVHERTIQEDRNFPEYGVDSIVALTLIDVINQKSNLTLRVTVLFEYNNVEQLLQYILQQHTSALKATLQECVLAKGSGVEGMQAPQGMPTHDALYTGYGSQNMEYLAHNIMRNSQWRRFQTLRPHHEPIAIIGMSGRFAHSKTVSELWEHLANGTDLVEEVSRWDLADLSPTAFEKNEPYCKHGSFLEGSDLFDPLFFNVSGLEATYMDPQQRLVLEEAWKALEDAGYAGESIEGQRCGVYVGCVAGDYQQLFEDQPPAQAFWGNVDSVVPARIAYYLNLAGPAIAIDTACSSSLVAMHLACQGLWSGEMDMALAGGVFLQCTPQFYQRASRAGMLSATGHCSTFDNRADGFVPGEGVGMVVLKRLKDALASGDHIYGVIRGSGMNQDGSTTGITVPSANAQERLECSVYETFQIDPSQIQMVEAHGTGTKLGDPIEYKALTRAFRQYTDKKEYCALGSIKTNLGHTITTAGVAGVIKILLSLQHKQIPPSLHFQSGNEHIQFQESPFYVNTRLKAWKVEEDGMRRCAAVSSFGFSGTNAHMVIEQAPEPSRRHAEMPGYLIVLSARTAEQLREQAEQLAAFCEQSVDLDCGNISYTLLLGRKHMKHRLACIVRSHQELRVLLRKWLAKGKVPEVSVSNLENREQGENASLRRYGNECIEDCQRAREPESYLEQLSTVADLYLQGYQLAFEQLFADQGYSRISLPTYPFARERYWIPISTDSTTTYGACRVGKGARGQRQAATSTSPYCPGLPVAQGTQATGFFALHPLVQCNTSTLWEQRFSSIFCGDEFFLADHVIKGQRIMPGVVYLEMARAAVDVASGWGQAPIPQASQVQAIGADVPQSLNCLRLSHVVWARPLVVSEHPVTVHISLEAQESRKVTFLISEDGRAQGTAPTTLTLLSQGTAELYEESAIGLIASQSIDLSAVQARCQHQVSATEWYEHSRSLGISHGSALQGIEQMRVGEDEVLARLCLPAVVAQIDGEGDDCRDGVGARYWIGARHDPYVLHPSMLDAALQACFALLMESHLPFELEELLIMGEVPARGWAWGRRKSSGTTGAAFDIEVCDDEGRIALRLRGLSTRMLLSADTLPTEQDTGASVLGTSPRSEAQSIPLINTSESRRTIDDHKRAAVPHVITDQMVKDHVQSIIVESMAKVLKIHQGTIRENRSFSEYGVDSLIAINLINIINQKSGLTLRTTVLFDNNNVEQLLQYILREHTVTLKAMLQERALANAKEMADGAIGTGRGQAPSLQAPVREMVINVERSYQDKPAKRFRTGASHVPTVAGSTYQRVIVERPGGIEDLTLSEADMPELKEREVRVAVHAFSLNFGDLLCVKGLYPTMPPYPFTPGFEASGVVIEVGRAVTDFKIGDPVITIAGATLGGHANVMTCPEERVFHKPATLSFEEACALPVVATTIIATFEKAHLKRGEKILIQTATSGTGLIAIQLAKYYGAEVYATAGSQLKLDYLKQLGVPYRINYQETDFEQEIERLTEGKGVDVVINTLSGDAIQKGMNCLASGGRYIEIAMTALKSARTIDLSVFSQNQTFHSVDLWKLAQSDPATLKRYYHEMLQLVEEGVITATISQIFAWEGLKEAYRYMEKRQYIGKIVVRIPEANQAAQRRGEIGNPVLPPSRVSAEALPRTIVMPHHEPIAIIGMSGRFPHSKTVSELWEHLANGTDLVEEVSRWDHAGLSPTAFEKNEPYCKHGSFLDGIDLFDPLFFNISGLEATYMDPQQRLVLEEAWKALEDAGYAGESTEGQRCGVYVGCVAGDYHHLFDSLPPAQAFWGNADSVVPARIAYYLNLVGPAIAIDTACSSSLVAMHLACQGLWIGETDMALAGGVFLQCTPQFYQQTNHAGMLSATGHCSTFDNRADGFVPGEGVGIVVLKRLKDALASGDHIYGVIRGSGINQDGATRGITIPSANAQERLECSVYETFQIDPSQIQMVEAHGTGTKLGDPIEYEALTRAFCQYTDKKEYCALGSIKTNLGHIATAAGIAGVIKVLLSLQHKQIPPSLHFQSGNEHIQFQESPFYVNTSLKAWESEADGTRRCAAVSSFGFSGTNAHMVIEQAPEPSRRHADMPGYLIVLSARTAKQLREQAEQLAAFCERNVDLDCGNISYTLLLGRKHMKHRLACVVRNSQELGALLRKWLAKGKVPEVSVSNLENRELGENASLRRYGNQCIQDCQRATEPESYLEQLSTVADLYLQGYHLAFEQFFAGQGYSRISLPAYPFARERYWVDELRQAQEDKDKPLSLRVEEVVSRGEVRPSRTDAPLMAQTMLLTPGWKEAAIAGWKQSLLLHSSAEGTIHPRQVVLLCELPSVDVARLQAQLTEGGYCRNLRSQQPRREQRFQDVVLQLMQELQYLLQSRLAGPVVVQVVIACREEPSFFEALVSVLKTVQQEHPKLRGQLIEVEEELLLEEGELLAKLHENRLRIAHEPHIRYRDGKRWVREWRVAQGRREARYPLVVRPLQRRSSPYVSAPPSMPWKEGGCYLISGGAGGLGRLFVQEIARQVQVATVILVGRSSLSQEECAQIIDSGWEHDRQADCSGIHIDYQQVDVSNGAAVHALVQRVLAQYGHLDGIIHAAGVLRDNPFLNKTQEEVQAVLAPKVIGVEQLDEASSQIPLDFFVLCSSLAAVVGNMGQCDYAAANAYLDVFARVRRVLVDRGQRQGATISINWPFWEAGGIQMDLSTIQMMRELLGEEPMDTETGMKTLYQALACGQAQVIVLHGQVERIKQRLLQRSGEHPVGAVQNVTASGREGGQAQEGKDLRTTDPLRRIGPDGACPRPAPVRSMPLQVPMDMLREALKHRVTRLLKVRVEEIDAETELSEYGFDSITFIKFADSLNQTYGLGLTPAIFYEYSTIERLSQYLETTYAAVLVPHFSAVPANVVNLQVLPDEGYPVEVSPTIVATTGSLMNVPDPLDTTSPIAIVGMSGAFPHAPDVQSLWSNLLEGKDCIGEIPVSRWDWEAYFGDPKTQANKTNVKWAGVIEGVDLFDPLFFGISKAEAERIDPQQRLLMMYVWKAIEDAGYAASSLSGTNTALFVGTISSGYSERLLRAGVAIEGYSSTSQVPSVGPNRMSYFLDLHGPSEPIETACSSSLVAIHRGVNAIQSGQCAMAIVGGVNTLVSPDAHVSLSKAGMLSEDGRCKTFSAQANGFVRSEGVGMLVLKKLSDAERDGDHIYGVIRGSAENHGGRASSFTAPNPRAQADLLIAAYRKAGIDPHTVGYIEAHGTGTALGDPIEIAGLKTAFSEMLQQVTGISHSPYSEGPMPTAKCGIGSVKSNIGHLELAAGVAGVIKVLLQLQHKKLVKSLHCGQINPYIQLEGSPFYVVQENCEWEALRDCEGNALPRRAGISSFGFGGVNAHVVLEEYVPKPQATHPGSLAQQPALIVLSARNEERLHEQVLQLLAWVQNHVSVEEPQDRYKAQLLRDLAYTLQVGREAMEERLALQVSSLTELEEKLGKYLQEPQEAGGWYRGQVRQQDAIGVFTADEDGQKAVTAWINKGKFGKLLALWVKGLTVDWKYLYGEERPCRISLPTYPFARERCWIPIGINPMATATTTNSQRVGTGLAPVRPPDYTTLHPLVQRNTSTLWKQQFSSTFYGDEFFLADHVVKGQRIMPGVAYLEMAHAAVREAIGADASHEPSHLHLSHVVWARPLVCDPAHPITIHITLEPQEDESISFLVGSDEQEEETGTQIYCQGRAELHAGSTARPKAHQNLDLVAVQARCRLLWDNATECYQHYRSLGINYGPAFQGIEQLSVGEGEALARLRLPVAPGAQTRTEGDKPLPYVLHPSVLDAALQACIGLLIGSVEQQGPHLPFALDELSIMSEVPAQGWAWVRHQQKSVWMGANPTPTLVFDIEVCDNEGRIAVGLRGLSTRMLPLVDELPIGQDTGVSTMVTNLESGQEPRTVPTPVALVGTLRLIPLWDPVILTQQVVASGNPTNHTKLLSEEQSSNGASGVSTSETHPVTIASLNPTRYQVVIVGGTADERGAITHLYPHAHTLEIPTDESIERLAQRLQEVGIVACGDGLPQGEPIPVLRMHRDPKFPLMVASPVPVARDSTLPAPHVFWLAPHDPQFALTQECILAAQQRGVLACFRLIKALLQLGYASQTLGFTVITRQARVLHASETGDPTHASLLGLFGSLTKEYAHWSIRLVDLPANAPLPLADVLRLPTDPQGHGWLYRNGHWYRQILVPLDVSPLQTLEAYRKGGVYVVIGGAGGIGEVVSEYLIRRYQAQIIWLGRRNTDAGIEAKLARLAALGPRPHYITADATDRSALQQAYQAIKRNFGQIHGVVHSAMVLLDQSLEHMDEEPFQAALAAKVEVSVRLAQVFEHERLDFVLFFSALNAFVPNAGQSNYAAGCTFEDAFAARLGRDWSCPVKVMNWGYWGSVGVVASREYRERMEQASLGSIEPAEAMEGLEYLLAGPVDQMVLLKTTKPLASVQMSEGPRTQTPWEEMIQTEEMVAGFGPEPPPSCIRELSSEAVPDSIGTRGEKTDPNQDGKREPSFADIRKGLQEMEAWLSKFLWSHLQSLGLFREKHAVLTNLREQAGISASYDRWLQESVALLERQQYLCCQGAICTVSDVAPLIESTTLWQDWDEHKEHWMRHADLKAHVILVEKTLRALPAILTGKRPATEILFPNGSMQLVEGIYQHNVIADYFDDVLATLLAAYLQERLVHDGHARIRILEIGAGTGGTTSRVLQMLQPYQASIAAYCYSDVSEAFLHYGQQMYGAKYPYLTYQILNVEKPLAGQGIEVGSYDVVIATNVLHATSAIQLTVRNTKATLKKYGLLLLNEITGTNLFAHLTFGLLEGWWSYEDPALRVPGCPALTAENWEAVLRSEGFRAISFPTRDMQEAGQQVIVAESDGVVRQARKGRSDTNAKASQSVGGVMRGSDRSLSCVTTDQMIKDHVQSIIVESIAEVLGMQEGTIQEKKSFSEYGVDSLVAIKLINVINQKSGLILRTTVLFDNNNVEQLLQYILREHSATLKTILQERAQAGTCEVEQRTEYPTRNITRNSRSITRVGTGQAPAYMQGAKNRVRTEFAPIHVQKAQNRVGTVHMQNTKNRVGTGLAPVPTAPLLPITPTPQRVIVQRPGGIDDLILSEADMPKLKEQEVRVAVRAFSLNFGDLLCVKGLYPTMPPYPFTPGFEASGVVIEVGRAVTAFKIGDPVMAIAGATLGAHASVMTCPEGHVFHKPNTLSFEDACALPVVATTVIAAFEKAHLKQGEKILIQTATGGTGLIALQLARYYGAEIYATAGSQFKLDYLKQLGVPYRINYRETDFAEEIERLTGGQGVDVVINTLSGDAMQKGMNCLASGGRYIEIAMTALKSASAIDLSVLSQNQAFYSLDLRKLAQNDPTTFKRYCHEMLKLVEKGVITATIGRFFPWERLKEAYHSLEERQNIGKIVVRIPQANQGGQTTEEMAELVLPESRVSAEARLGTIVTPHHEPIAIIGMSGRFARSKTMSELWEHLANGTDLVEEVSRWDHAELDPAAAERKEPYCKRGSFLDGIDLFDPLFFNISGLEATYMDPQQRLVLEEAWKALEDAGYAGESIEGRRCGVYVGCSAGDYKDLFDDLPPAQAFWGNAGSVVPARIAYYLNLVGPAIAIDTACSSSLVAMHLACQGLWSGEMDMALAGGVFLQCTPQFYQVTNRAGMLSVSGHCSAFDNRADGFVPGEGVAMVVLKRLKDALASGDQIYGVIRGSGINQDGATRGITVPSANSQERLMRSVYETFGIKPKLIQMVEAHGTGTKLGDPIEYEALTRAFRKDTDRSEYCALGSIKTNLGHTATAAGVAGVIKILLSLQHKQIPPSLHFQSGNEHIQFKESPFYVNTGLKEWEAEGDGLRRCAAVSSFGFSGTNAHMVIEEAPTVVRRHAERPGYLIVLSARTADQLQQQVEQLATFCEASVELDCGNISYTLLLGRKHMKHRLACVVRSHQELGTLLRKWLEKGKVSQVSVSDLENREQRENASLRRYGNQCIEDCRHTTEPETYLEQLSTVADLYLQGYRLAFDQFFAGEEYSRISLPTYPFARNRYWISTPTVDNEQESQKGTTPFPTPMSNSAAAVTTSSPMGSVHPRSSGTSLSLIAQPEAEAIRTVPGSCPAPTKRVALRPLVDHPVLSHRGYGLSQPSGPRRADQPQPSIGLSLSGQSFSEPGRDDEVTPEASPRSVQGTISPMNTSQVGAVGTGLAPVRLPTVPDSTLQAPQLEKELIRSLAKVLYIEQSDIGVEVPFRDLGLDSVSGIEWIQSVNKQYASNFAANCVYGFPTIRQLAGFLQKELLKHQQTAVQPMATSSLDDVLQQVQQGNLDTEKAEELLNQLSL